MKYKNHKYLRQTFKGVPFAGPVWPVTDKTAAPVIKSEHASTVLGDGTVTAVDNVAAYYYRVPQQQLHGLK